MKREVWKPCPHFAGFHASSRGRVAYEGEVLTDHRHTAGYRRISYYDPELRKRRSLYVHRLVCDAFHGEVGFDTNHKNGVKDDNRPCNLEPATRKQNIEHARDVLGMAYGVVKLRPADVRVIRKLCRIGLNQEAVGRVYGVSQADVSLTVNRKLWRWVR